MKTKRFIRVIVADDHDTILDGIGLLLKADPDTKLVATARNGRELLELVRQHSPDVALVDLRMPVVDGITAIRIMKEAHPEVRIVVLSMYNDQQMITEAMEAGALGYVVKNAERGEIVEAIKKVYNGYPSYCSTTTKQLAMAVAKTKADPYRIAVQQQFSQREKDIIRLICQENSNEDIAAILFISIRTVEGVRKRIMEKMQVKTVAGLSMYAVRHGLFHIEDMR